METYYTTIIVISWLSLGVLSILVQENDRLDRSDKRMLYLSYALIALAALAEWFGVYLDGSLAYPVWMLRTVKCADYILTPLAGGSLVAQLRGHSVRRRVLMYVLAFNAVFQIVSLFTGWMLHVDAQNHYSKGPLYGVYFTVYVLVISLTVIEFRFYGKSFRHQNHRSLYAILLLVLAGILMQELIAGKPRTAYITLTTGMAMLFIHNMEYSQLKADDHMQAQMIQITTDALTGLLSRYAYAKALEDLDARDQLPEDLAVFSIDVNGLKAANDSLGHTAGDELIRAAAHCIETVLGPWGTCYRTGGDEFIVLARMNRSQADKALAKLTQEAAAWQGEEVKELHLAAGYALSADHPALTSEKLIQEADMAMYAAKAGFYSRSGTDRRTRRRV